MVKGIPMKFKAMFFWLFTLTLSVFAETVEIQFLQTTDIHGFIKNGDDPEGGGWLRLAALIGERRAQYGPERTLLIDCGDTCQGTLAASFSRGQIAPELLNGLKYDVWTTGNHELDFGVRRFHELCQTVGKIILCGNLSYVVDGRKHCFPAWRMFERGGARIAVIGANARYLDNWLWGKSMKTYTVESAVSMLRRIMPEILKSTPDMIVLAIHQGWLLNDSRNVNEIPEIVQHFPEIDLILGGHTHRSCPGTRLGRKTWYVQAGKHADNLAVILATIDPQQHEVVNVTSHLVPATSDTPVDSDARQVVSQWLSRVKEFSEKPVGQLSKPITASGRAGEACGTSELICQAIAAATHANIVLHGSFSDKDLAAGMLRELDLYAVIPYENSIGLARLTEEELKQIIEEQYANRKSYAYNGVWGAHVTVNRQGKVTHLAARDMLSRSDQRLLVALNSYVIAGGGGRFPRLREILRRPDAHLVDSGIDTRDALRRFLKENSPFQLQMTRWLTRQIKVNGGRRGR